MTFTRLLLVAAVAAAPLSVLSAPVMAASAHNLANGTDSSNTNDPGMANTMKKPAMSSTMMKKPMKTKPMTKKTM